MMRFLSALFIILSYFTARYEFGIIITLMSLSWGAVAGAFMAPYLYGLFWKRTTLAGAYAGMITGLVVSIGLFFYLSAEKSAVASSLGMIIPFFIVPLVSVLTKKPDGAIIEKAFEKI